MKIENKAPLRLLVKWTKPYFHGQSLQYTGEVVFIYRSWGATWFTVAVDHGTFKEIRAIIYLTNQRDSAHDSDCEGAQ